MTVTESINIPVVSVDETKNLLMKLFGGAIKCNIPFCKVPTPFLWGAPGIGKSQSVYQIAEEISFEFGLKVNVTDVRLILYNPIDLRGMPSANNDKTLAVWLKPKVFDMDPGKDTVNILFLDELSAAHPTVQASAYQICLDRKVGEHELPDNCIVIAAGNRTTDHSVSYKMPKALCNRLLHFNVRPDYQSWRRWAVKNNVASEIIAYLAFDNSKLCSEPDLSDIAYPTPRSWEFVNTIMKIIDCDSDVRYQLIASCVGNDTAIEFKAFCNGTVLMPPVSDILEGRCKVYPKKHDVMYVLISSLVSALNEKGSNVTMDELENVWDYVSRFPKEYLMLFTRDIRSISAINAKLMKCYGFQDWLAKNMA